MAIEIIAVSRYSWLGRPLDGRWSISAVVRRTQIKSALFVPSALAFESRSRFCTLLSAAYIRLTRGCD